MRELSLHILDLIENSIRAGATVVAVTVEEEPEWNSLRIAVEDNGPGLGVPPDLATDPFYTTKTGKRTGLGLALFRFRVEQAGGELALERSLLGGTAVRATVSLGHVDRSPLGDLASTLASVVVANPDLEVLCRLKVGSLEQALSTSELARATGREEPGGQTDGAPRPRRDRLAVAREMQRRIQEGILALQLKE